MAQSKWGPIPQGVSNKTNPSQWGPLPGKNPQSSVSQGIGQTELKRGPAVYNTEGESPIGTVARLGAQGATRLAGLAGGGAANIAEAGLGLGNFLTGGRIPTYEQIEKERGYSLPTSEGIKERIGEATGGYTNPQSWERDIGDTIETGVSLLNPGKLATTVGKGVLKTINNSRLSQGVGKGLEKYFLPYGTSKVTPWKAAKVAGVSHGVKHAAEFAGASPAVQTALQVGAQIAMMTPPVRKELEDVIEPSLYKESRNALRPKILKEVTGKDGIVKEIWSPEEMVNTKTMRDKVSKAKTRATNSLNPNEEELVKYYDKVLNAIDDKASGDQMKVADLLDLKINNNAWITELDSRPLFAGQKHLPKALRGDVARVTGYMKKPLEKVAESNKEFGKAFNAAEDLHKGLYAFDKGTRFLADNTSITDNMEAIMSRKLGAGSIAVGAGLGLFKTAADVAKFKNVWAKSPVARTAYLKGMAAAAEENLPAATKAFAQLAHEMAKNQSS